MGCASSSPPKEEKVPEKLPEPPPAPVEPEVGTPDNKSSSGAKRRQSSKRDPKLQNLVDVVSETSSLVNKKTLEFEDITLKKIPSNSSIKRPSSAPRSDKKPLSDTKSFSDESKSQTNQSIESMVNNINSSPTSPTSEPANTSSISLPRVPSSTSLSSPTTSASTSPRAGIEKKASVRKATTPLRRKQSHMGDSLERLKFAEKVSQRGSVYGDRPPVLDASEKFQMKELAKHIQEADLKEKKKFLTVLEKKCVNTMIHFHDTNVEKEDYPPWALTEFEAICLKYSAYLNSQNP